MDGADRPTWPCPSPLSTCARRTEPAQRAAGQTLAGNASAPIIESTRPGLHHVRQALAQDRRLLQADGTEAGASEYEWGTTRVPWFHPARGLHHPRRLPRRSPAPTRPTRSAAAAGREPRDPLSRSIRAVPKINPGGPRRRLPDPRVFPPLVLWPTSDTPDPRDVRRPPLPHPGPALAPHTYRCTRWCSTPRRRRWSS